jgi:deazaflavin-dependent oxidoreductase (nitroreductase family)
VNAVKDTMARLVTALHRTIYRLTGGRVGSHGFGMPVVILTTVGRKSGKRRDTMLTSPIREEGRTILVASYGGDDRDPQWFLNLRANPEVELTVDGQTTKMRARVAGDEERGELWPRVVESYKGYGQYQTRTERQIPLVILES